MASCSVLSRQADCKVRAGTCSGAQGAGAGAGQGRGLGSGGEQPPTPESAPAPGGGLGGKGVSDQIISGSDQNNRSDQNEQIKITDQIRSIADHRSVNRSDHDLLF